MVIRGPSSAETRRRGLGVQMCHVSHFRAGTSDSSAACTNYNHAPLKTMKNSQKSLCSFLLAAALLTSRRPRHGQARRSQHGLNVKRESAVNATAAARSDASHVSDGVSVVHSALKNNFAPLIASQRHKKRHPCPESKL